MSISSEIINFAAFRTNPFSKKDLLKFFKAGTEEVSAETVNVLLDRLVEGGKLAKIGRGLFSFSGNIKPPYIYKQSEAEIEMASDLKRMFPFVTCCVWKANAITPFMQHIPSMSFVLVDVERVAMDAVFQHLQRKYPKSMILLNPTRRDCDRYLNMDNIIVVRPLIAEAPLSTYRGMYIPSIEKILVDIVCDIEFDYVCGAELSHIYDNALESVNVNQKKLLRYSSRRNRKDRIKQILNLQIP